MIETPKGLQPYIKQIVRFRTLPCGAYIAFYIIKHRGRYIACLDVLSGKCSPNKRRELRIRPQDKVHLNQRVIF